MKVTMRTKTTILAGVMLAVIVMTGGPVLAEVPHRFNLQSIVYDGEGNVTASDEVNVLVRLLDGDGNVLWQETHDGVQVIEGAINVGVGDISPLSLDLLDPSDGGGMRLIDVEVEGQSPWEILPLGAVPYSMWAEKSLTVANDSVGTEQIANGSILAEDINPEAFTGIRDAIAALGAVSAKGQDLTDHINNPTGAHNAAAIVLSGHYVTFVADDVQEALQKLDAKLVDEIVNRKNMMIDSAHIVDGTITTQDIANGTIKAEDLATGAGSGFEGWDTNASDDITTSGGTISGGNLTVGRDIVMDSDANCTARVGHPCQVDGVDVSSVDTNPSDDITTSGGTITGDLQVNGNIGVTGTVDSVDVSASIGQLNQRVFSNADPLNHEDRIHTLENAFPMPVALTRSLRWNIGADQANGGALGSSSYGGDDDSAAWTKSGGGADDEQWVTITRNAISVPAGCLALASGTARAHIEDAANNDLGTDEDVLFFVNYSGSDIIMSVQALGDDGDYDIVFKIIAFPTADGVDCTLTP